jgi:hypothetical protein
MAYNVPTAADLKTRYPAFAAVPDATVEYWIGDAQRFVDEGWREADYGPALLSRAAHEMALAGIGASSGIPEGVTSFKSGSFSASISDAAAQAQVKGGLQATRYGREFAAILRRNFAGPRLVVGEIGPQIVIL